MHNKFYLSIKTTNLAHYIQKAIILPSRFYNNRPEDIQNLFGEYLFLSNIPFINDSDCSIELVLTEKEMNNLKKINHNILLFNRPLPISRIKNIYFFNDDQKLLTIAKINSGAGFINENIVKVLKKTDETVLNIEIPEIESFSYSDELQSKIKDFEQKLGGIAFVRFNTSNRYSKSYFSILSFFNKLIKEEYEKNSGLKITNSYDGAFSCDGRWKNLASLIYEPILEENVIASAKKDNINITKDIADNFELTKIDSQTDTYKLAVLNTYGSDSTKRKSIDDLVFSLISGAIEPNKHEGISLIFGINNGYATFYNQYKEKIVKFKMDSILDYYTVESIFQYVINNNSNLYRFKYLDNIVSKKPLLNSPYYETIQILDETVITGTPTVMSDIKSSEESGMFATALFDRLKSFIEKMLKKKNEIEILLYQKQKENKELATKLVIMTEDINKLTTKNQTIELKAQEEQIKLKELQVKNSELLQLATKNKSQIDELNKQLPEIQFQLKEEKEKNKELDSKVANLNRNLEDKEFKLQEEEKRLQEQEEKYKELLNDNTDFRNQITRLNNKIKEKEAQLEKTQNEAIGLNRKITNLEKNINDIKTTNQINESILQEEKVKYVNLIEEHASCKKKIETLNKEKLELEIQQQDTYKKNNELEASLEKARGIYREQQSKIKSFEVKIDETPQKNQKNLNSMRKPELLELAKQQGIHVSSKDTVQQLIDKINLNVSSLF